MSILDWIWFYWLKIFNLVVWCWIITLVKNIKNIKIIKVKANVLNMQSHINFSCSVHCWLLKESERESETESVSTFPSSSTWLNSLRAARGSLSLLSGAHLRFAFPFRCPYGFSNNTWPKQRPTHVCFVSGVDNISAKLFIF